MKTRPERHDRWGRWLPIAGVVALLGALAALIPARGVSGSQGDGGVKVVVHVNFAQTTHQEQGLKNIENILRAAADQGSRAEVEVVCHGDGIRLVEKARTELAGQVASLRAQGVRFVACANTMRQRSLAVEDLLPGVPTVPSGAYEVVVKQHSGYAYFKP